MDPQNNSPQILLPPGIETVIVPRAHDLGGFEVRRALPARERQMVGPFIFFDQMGPGEFLIGQALTCGRTRTSASRR
jgi:redox-sensitive bicupin YhaK (pirin superfamily)